MESLSGALWLLGGAVAVVGFIWVLGVAFSESVVWGVACMLIPIAPFLLLLSRPREAWKPSTLYLVGIGLIALASALAPIHR
jgi:ABC-type Fe3+-siderophore transport system permease subunit